MKRHYLHPLALLISATFISTMANAEQTSDQIVDALSHIDVKINVVDNQAGEHGMDCAALGADWAACNRVDITLTNGDRAIESADWALYFHSIRQILKQDNPQFTITHLTGDLHKITPTEQFNGIKAHEKIVLPVTGEYWQVSYSDFMPRWYATSGDARPRNLKSTDTQDSTMFVAPFEMKNWKRTGADNNVLMTPENRYQKNLSLQTLSEQQLRGQILPTPLDIKIQEGNADLSNGVKLQLDGLTQGELAVINEHLQQVKLKQNVQGFPILGKIAPRQFAPENQVSGAYELVITPQQAEIIGYDHVGLFYGMQSLLSAVTEADRPSVATMIVKDKPRMDYRGVFLDVGRNFHSKQMVKRLIDQMSRYKLNKFHFHLTDDEGWRIEIPGLPELTEVGSQRCHDLDEQTCLLPQLGSGAENNNMGSGYFTRDDYIDILRYAKDRNIEVIPEIDMPAHARAAVVSMEARYNKLKAAGNEAAASEYRLVDPSDTSVTTSVQFYDKRSYLNPCLDSSKNFVNKVVSEVMQMHKEAGVPLKTWHFGGDEAKNIRLGAGFQDKAGNIELGKGIIDKQIEDKPWAKSEACQALIKRGDVSDFDHLSSHFAKQVSESLQQKGVTTMQAWQDGLKDASSANDFATDNVRVNFWDTLYWGGFDSANDWANKGYQVVISNPDYVYLDMPYEVNPNESGYYWATRASDEQKIFSFAPDNLPQNAETSVDRDGNSFSAKSDKPWPGVYGLSGQLWSEAVRTDDKAEYMLFPRILPLAERAWHKAQWENQYQIGREYIGGKTNYVSQQKLADDWSRFASLVGMKELPRLDRAGVAYRIPVPGAKIENGLLLANISYPGLVIEYALADSDHWQTYSAQKPPKVKGNVKVRAKNPAGTRTSRVETVVQK
ncbi:MULTISPECIES: beta-N-acetylhexosaminidase [Providencia]|uniref:beta-N-acetylhexosaminidase n=1 Tax=Providencia TaxID=586 RepID=UPI0029903C20|nr:beta-N-acetylhexosaminidase [Providencia sp. PROV080]